MSKIKMYQRIIWHIYLNVFNKDFNANKATLTQKFIYKLIIDKDNEKLILKIYDNFTGFLLKNKVDVK